MELETKITINYQRDKIKDTSNKIELINETIKCGEIFVSSSSNFNYTCSNCDLKFDASELFLKHFIDDHISKIFSKSECEKVPKINKSDNNNIEIEHEGLEKFESSSSEQISSLDAINETKREKVEPSWLVEEISNFSNDFNNDGEELLNESDDGNIEYLECNYCNVLCRQGQEHQEHEKQHIIKINACQVCRICGKSFKNKRSCLVHERIHTGEKPFSCKFCPKKFTQMSSQINHERRHTGERPYKCKFCDKSFHQRGLMTTHQLLHVLPQKPFLCQVCNKRFLRKHNLEEHMNTHKYKPDKPYPCLQCSKYFKTPASLKSHAIFHRIEQYIYKCDYCEKKFPAIRMKVNHELTHTLGNSKSYKCNFCSNLYSRKGSLSKHISKWHSSEIPSNRTYNCQYCNKVFKKEGSKSKHEKKHEFLNNEVKIFQCNLCDKKYGFRSGLMKHKNCKHYENFAKVQIATENISEI